MVEVGAGLGSLTVALAASGARVLAIELDRRLSPVLRDSVEPLGVRVLQADAMRCDWEKVLASSLEWVLVANLPYNIAVPLLLDLLTSVPRISRMLVMVQREVGERLAAVPGDAAYGAVSVRVAYFAEASLVGRVPASVFLPRPSVESVLVRLGRLDVPAVDPADASFEEIDRLVRAGFATRRKMLRRSLAGLVTAEAFDQAGVAPTARAEELSVSDFGRLARAAAVARG